MELWKAYFESLLNEENPRKVREDGVANLGVTRDVTREEVAKGVQKMKTNSPCSCRRSGRMRLCQWSGIEASPPLSTRRKEKSRTGDIIGESNWDKPGKKKCEVLFIYAAKQRILH